MSSVSTVYLGYGSLGLAICLRVWPMKIPEMKTLTFELPKFNLTHSYREYAHNEVLLAFEINNILASMPSYNGKKRKRFLHPSVKDLILHQIFWFFTGCLFISGTILPAQTFCRPFLLFSSCLYCEKMTSYNNRRFKISPVNSGITGNPVKIKKIF
jgi:hypothetical protein